MFLQLVHTKLDVFKFSQELALESYKITRAEAIPSTNTDDGGLNESDQQYLGNVSSLVLLIAYRRRRATLVDE